MDPGVAPWAIVRSETESIVDWSSDDPYGNRSFDHTEASGSPTYVYDERNRLVERRLSDTGALVARYRYDAFGRRVARDLPDGSLYRYLYDRAGRPLEVVYVSAADEPAVFDFLWVEGELLGRVEEPKEVGLKELGLPGGLRGRGPAGRLQLLALALGGSLLLVGGLGAVRGRRPARWALAGGLGGAVVGLGGGCVPTQLGFFWIHTDHLGVPVAMTDTPTDPLQTKVVWRMTYDPFGRAIEDVDPDGDGTLLRMESRLPGQLSDNGFYANGFRDYDPRTGRYLEPDPIGQRGSINLFQYARGNSLRYIDPLGLATAEDLKFAIRWFNANRPGRGDPIPPDQAIVLEPFNGAFERGVLGDYNRSSGIIRIASEIDLMRVV